MALLCRFIARRHLDFPPCRSRVSTVLTVPSDAFARQLRVPTIWVPHSYPGCSQHAPDEHILLPVTEEALTIMAGLFWDLGEAPLKG